MKWNCLIAILLITPLVALGCAPAASAPAPAATTTPAAFTTSNLTVTPATVKPGEPATVGVTVTNTGGAQGTYTVMVKLHDGSIVGMQDVTLAGGASKNVALSISLNSPGTHMLMVDDLDRNLVVQGASAATMPPMPNMPTPPPPATPPATPPAIPPATPPATPPPAGMAAFTIADLGIEPTMPEPGDNVTISVKVTNTGGQQGTYKVVLSVINTQTKAVVDTKTQDVTLAGGASKVVNLTIIAGNIATYTIKIDTLECPMEVMVM